MLALPDQSLDISWNFLQIGLGIRNLFKKSTAEDSLEERAKHTRALSDIQGFLSYAEEQLQQNTQTVVKTTETIRALNRTSLSSTEYKTLRVMKDDIQKQLDMYFSMGGEVEAEPDHSEKWMHRYLAARQEQLLALNDLFSQGDFELNEIDSFRNISQDEAWETRTQAYDYSS